MSEVVTESIDIKCVNIVSYFCDNCHSPHVQFTGERTMTLPVKHKHKCLNCNTIMNLKELYPKRVLELANGTVIDL